MKLGIHQCSSGRGREANCTPLNIQGFIAVGGNLLEDVSLARLLFWHVPKSKNLEKGSKFNSAIAGMRSLGSKILGDRSALRFDDPEAAVEVLIFE